MRDIKTVDNAHINLFATNTEYKQYNILASGRTSYLKSLILQKFHTAVMTLQS